MDKQKLRIGLIIDDYSLSNWKYRILEEFKNSNFAEISLIIRNNRSSVNRSSRFFRRFSNGGSLLLNIHLKLDKFILGRSVNYSKKINSTVLLKGIPEISLTTAENGFTNKLEKREILKVRDFSLDIILNFGVGQLIGDILTIPKYGVWSYGSGSQDGQLGYWEVIKKIGITGSVLHVLNENLEKDVVIHRSQVLTYPMSISKNKNLSYWKAATIIPYIIKALSNFGEPYFLNLQSKYDRDANFYSREFNEAPLFLTVLENMVIHFLKVNKRLLQKLFFVDHWDVLYRIKSTEMFISSLNEFKLLPSPIDRFWADPFVVTKEDRHFIFVEELIYETNKGHIAVVELDDQGNFISSKKVLERNYHLSYPFLLKIDDTHYMIPETGENKTVEIYKCIEFPYKWEFVMNLMEGIRTGDVTVFYHNNRWWLFACVDKTGIHEGILDELHLFYSDDLFTKDWQSHPCNPINTDTRTARPAGEIFIKDGKIYRPSQDCSGIYGRGVNLNEIIKLSETEYEEVLMKKIIPEVGSSLLGTHTFNSDNKITVIDGFRYRRRRRIT